MNYQLPGNEQGLRDYSQERYRDLQREADRERQANQVPQPLRSIGRRYDLLIPIAIGLGVALANLAPNL